MSILAFAGWGDDPSMPPGGIRFDTFQPRSFMSDYIPGMDMRWPPATKPGVGSWLDDLVGGVTEDASGAASAAIVAQIPAIVAATVASSAYQREANAIRTQAVVGGLLFAGIILGGVYLMKK